MIDKPKILIVDDQDADLNTLEKLLSDLEIEIIRANSGKEALQKIQEHEFALALVDVGMPEMDGYETVKRMRQMKETALIPVIFISAIHSESNYMMKSIESGAVDFITKPLIPEILTGKVRVFLDLWRHKQILQKSEANLCEAQRIAHLGSWDINLVSGNIYWSDELYRIFEIPAQEPDLRKALSRRIHPDDWERYRKTVDRCIRERKPYQVEYRILLDDGSVRHIHAQGVQTRNNDGELIRFAGTAQDITERKKIEESLLEANQQLKELDKIKSDFVSTASHELRTPIAIIHEGISLCLDGIAGDITDTQKELLTDTLSNIARLKRLVTDLLDISKIEAGKMEIRRSSVDLCELIYKILKSYDSQAKEKEIHIKALLPDKPLFMFIDEDKITQIFNNLINNAIRFSKKGGCITIGVDEQEEAVRCSVVDTGIGIAKENLPKLFSKFEQFGKAEGSGYKGTGLGLTIVKALVEKHSGQIGVESVMGKGTTFRFTLKKEPFPKILIVDDDENYAEVIKRFMIRENYLTKKAHDGKEAVQRAQKEEPALIILDMKLPGMSGYEVIGRLKQDTRTQNIPIIISSGYQVDDKILQHINGPSAIPILPKPIDPEVLKSTVRELLLN